jgi:hypothetical protein
MNFKHPILEHVRRRPALFLGRPSLVRLQAFIQGYSACECDHHFEVVEQDTSEFCDWLSGQLRIPSNVGYVNMLLAVSDGDDAVAFDSFWSWLDKFRALQKVE